MVNSSANITFSKSLTSVRFKPDGNIVYWYGNYDTSITSVPFDTSSWAEILSVLLGYYAGVLEPSTYWSVGDSRTIHLNAMEATGVSESHHADDYEFIILDFDHDTLTNPVYYSDGTISKAAITLQTKRILYKNMSDTSYSSNYPEASDEGGYMNSTDTNVGGWDSCARRTWCNSVLFEALPTEIQSYLKIVNKLTSAGNKSSTIITSSDSCFLLSETEIFGSGEYSVSGEGTKYSYFSSTEKIYKLPAYNSYNSAIWWTRSPNPSRADTFASPTTSGGKNDSHAISTMGIAPAFCL